MKILFIGEIVGKAGVYCIKKHLSRIKEEEAIDFVIANGDGTTGGFGLGKNHSIYLRKLGIEAITSGECIYYKKDMTPHIQKAPYILRPANFPPGNPGRGWGVFEAGDRKIGVISLLGQAGFNRVHLSNPFTYIPELISRIHQITPTILLDFHAVTTAEKKTMGEIVRGKITAMIGTGTKALSADETILDGRTAVITDTGRTGSILSAGGFEPETEIQQLMNRIPVRSKDCWEGLEIQGVIVEADEQGFAQSIRRLRIPCPSPEKPSQPA